MEDIAFLQDGYDQDQYLFYVDSDRRDKITYPKPNDYQIQFSKPFTNVVGLDIINATIPRTEYLLDHDTNRIAYKIGDGLWQLLEIGAGDYNINTLSALLTQGLTDGGKNITVKGLTQIIDLQSRLQFYCIYPFVLDMTATTMRPLLGFGDPICTRAQDYNVDPSYLPGHRELFYSKLDTGNIQSVTAFQGPTPITASFPLTQPVAQQFITSFTGPVTSISITCDIYGNPPLSTGTFTIADPQGVIAVTGNVNYTSDNYRTPTTSSDVTSLADLQSGQTYTITYTSPLQDSGNCYSVFYTAPTVPTVGNILPVTVGNTTIAGEQLSCSVTQGGYYNVINSPGIFTLVGQRYLTIRCPEIESQLYRDRPFDPYSVGLAKVPLGNFGYGQNSYDFSSVPIRTFRPIARLQSLTFTFERPDEQLYDFKGINHTMTLLMRFYTPPPVPLSRWITDKTYKADPHQYKLDIMQQEMDRRRAQHKEMVNHALR